jgi:hypothetical protein
MKTPKERGLALFIGHAWPNLFKSTFVNCNVKYIEKIYERNRGRI